MDSKNTYGAIRKIFHFRGENHSLPWGTSKRYGRDLFPILFARAGRNIGAEIGVRKGRFSKKICEANPNLKLFCVDPWYAYDRYTQEMQDQLYEEAVKNLAPYNTVIIRKTSMDALNDFEDKSLDFVHIDGNHTFDFVCPDLIFWVKKVKSGGIITLHDYHCGLDYGVVNAVDAYTRSHHIDPWFVTKESQPTAFWVNP